MPHPPVLASLQQRLPLKRVPCQTGVVCTRNPRGLKTEPGSIPLFGKIKNSSLQHQRLQCTTPLHHQFPPLYDSLYTESAHMCNVFFWFLISPPNSEKTCTWNNAFNPFFYLACILLTFLKNTLSVAICVLPSSYFSVVRLNTRYSIFNSFPNNVNHNLISTSLSISCRSWVWHCVGYNHKTTAKQCYIYSTTNMV